MKDFWISCGHHLLDRNASGGLVVTDEFLKAYFARPELMPPEDACAIERRLHRELLAEPAVGMADGEAVVDELEPLPEAIDEPLVELLQRGRLAAGPIEHDDDDREDDEIVDEPIAHIQRDEYAIARRHHKRRDDVMQPPEHDRDGEEPPTRQRRPLLPPRPVRQPGEHEHHAADDPARPVRAGEPEEGTIMRGVESVEGHG